MSPELVNPFSFGLAVDRLSALFLLIICGVSLPVAVYSGSYLPRHYSYRKCLFIWAFFFLFVLSMVLVVLASTAFAFLFAWELMTLTSASLILLDGVTPERRHDLFIYLVMMHAGAAFVAAAFFSFLPFAASLTFESMRQAGALLTPSARTAIFVLGFAGFATKAGLIPLHLWLPRAHPIAPTPVSALMSGVMLKTAVYGFVRLTFDFLGGGPWWGGYLALFAGAISALLGILYAIGEHDLKRLLAYSSVENLGIIYMALGTSLVFAAHHRPQWATLALTAALLHSVNHALFKSLLFLGAGAISDAARTLSLNHLGGLLRRMPATGFAFLVGCASIVGLPLTNGFVSELLAYQAFLAGPMSPGPYSQAILPLMAGVLAMTGGLAAACFIQVYAIAFLGRPRTEGAETAVEAPLGMRAGMIMLGAACLALGVVPGPFLEWLVAVSDGLIAGASAPEEVAAAGSVAIWAGIALFAAAAVPLLWRSRRRITPIWACGLPGLTTRMQYTATAFSKPIRSVFTTVYKPERKLDVLPDAYAPVSISYHSVRTTSWEKSLYRPIVEGVVGVASQLRRLQTGNMQGYLLYIFLTLIALLAFVGWRR